MENFLCGKSSEDFKINVLGLYLEGNSIRGIERKLKVSDTSIINWIRNEGIIVKNKFDKAKNIINDSMYNNDYIFNNFFYNNIYF